MTKITTIVGIFDNGRDMDQAVERLAAAGFDDTVYDEAIVAEEPGKLATVAPIPVVGPVLVPGAIPPQASGSVEADLPQDRQGARRASHGNPEGVRRLTGKSA